MENGKKHEVLIVGAGASGMMAAVALAQRGVDVALLEANDVPGKKILATGNGKCNFTNTFQSAECYRGEQPEAAMELLKRYDALYVLHFFEELGIPAKQRDGYWYPNSEQAVSVREAFELRLCELSVPIYRNTHVEKVRKEKNFLLTASYREKLPDGMKKSGKASGKKPGKPIFSESRDICFEAEYVVLATGGCAGNISGADGSGYALVAGFGHRIVPLVPALVQLKLGWQNKIWPEKKVWQALAGVRTAAELSLYIEKTDGTRQEYREQGEILFTDYGLSGIPTMQLSRFAARELGERQNAVCEPRERQNTMREFAKRECMPEKPCGKIEVSLDFFPDTSENDLKRMLLSRFERFQSRTVRDALLGLLPEKLNTAILSVAGIAADASPFMQNSHLPQSGALGHTHGQNGKRAVSLGASAQNSRKAVSRCADVLAHCMKHFTAPVCGTNGFENAQVTAGGVALSELDAHTMESKLAGGLYVIGELADIDGTCGGYNLQWAWMSGLAAAEAICGRKKK